MNITLIFSSFVAGMLTILAPCILTLLPVIIGSTASSKDPSKPFIVTASLGVSIVIFTLLLKASTIFISVPPYFWNYLSGGIVLLFFSRYVDSMLLKHREDEKSEHYIPPSREIVPQAEIKGFRKITQWEFHPLIKILLGITIILLLILIAEYIVTIDFGLITF